VSVPETAQNRETLKRHPKQVRVEDIFSDPGSSDQINESMVALPECRHRLSECLVPMRAEDARTREVVCYRRVRISGGEPEIIGNSRLSDAMSAEQIDIIVLLLSDLALLSRRRNDRR
jgi:hypothetical protein